MATDWGSNVSVGRATWQVGGLDLLKTRKWTKPKWSTDWCWPSDGGVARTTDQGRRQPLRSPPRGRGPTTRPKPPRKAIATGCCIGRECPERGCWSTSTMKIDQTSRSTMTANVWKRPGIWAASAAVGWICIGQQVLGGRAPVPASTSCALASIPHRCCCCSNCRPSRGCCRPTTFFREPRASDSTIAYLSTHSSGTALDPLWISLSKLPGRAGGRCIRDASCMAAICCWPRRATTSENAIRWTTKI